MPSPPASRTQRVLLVDDDDGVRRSLTLLLQGYGFDVRAHASTESVLRLPTLDDIDLLISDYRLATGDGIELLKAMRETGWRGRAVLIATDYSPALVERAMAAGFHAVLDKPLQRHMLIAALTG